MKRSLKGLRLTSLVLTALASLSTSAHSYEVWMGTLGWQQAMQDHPEQWARTAALVEGLNVNWAPGKKGEGRLGRSLRREVIAKFAKAKDHAYQVTPHGTGKVTDESEWDRSFSRAKAYGYKLEYLYTYSAGPGKNWKDAEHGLLRGWLDRHDHGDVRIAFNGRSGHGQLERAVVQGNGIECDLRSWKENKGGRHELLRWMADPKNTATKGEKIIIHCHLNYGKGSNVADLVDAWAGARLMVRDIGRDVMNTDELKEVFRSDRLVFAFFGANWDTSENSLLPETKDDATYAESYTGLLLSLIEQREMFEAASGKFPDDEQCKSFARKNPDAAKADPAGRGETVKAVGLSGDVAARP